MEKWSKDHQIWYVLHPGENKTEYLPKNGFFIFGGFLGPFFDFFRLKKSKPRVIKLGSPNFECLASRAKWSRIFENKSVFHIFWLFRGVFCFIKLKKPKPRVIKLGSPNLVCSIKISLLIVILIFMAFLTRITLNIRITTLASPA